MGETREVGIYNGHPSLAFREEEVSELFHSLDNWPAFHIPPGNLSIAFLTDVALASLHRSFLDDSTTTDVITFPGTEESETDPEAGEICISVDTAVRAAQEHGETLAREITLYLVHGWLHLAGLRDKTETERQAMRAAEKSALEQLHQQAMLPEFSFTGK